VTLSPRYYHEFGPDYRGFPAVTAVFPPSPLPCRPLTQSVGLIVCYSVIVIGINPLVFTVSGTPQFFSGKRRGREKGKGLEGGERKGEREVRNGDTP